MESWQESIEKLMTLLDSRKDLKDALEISIRKAAFPETKTLEQYYHFLNELLTEIPTQRKMSPSADKFHYLISLSPGNILKKDEAFRIWLRGFSQNFGSFLDTTASAGALDTFIRDPGYHIDQYDPGASGWLTFNQFFARHVKPGKRPVEEIFNNNIIVSASDSVYLGYWPVDNDSKITAKGVTYSLMELLDGSPYREKFRGGLFTHSYLDSNDYHRFHVPVGGAIREVRKIPGDVIVNTIKATDGSLVTLDEVGFQFTQTRGLIVIDSPVGLVAVLPIGMGHVSSVNLTAEPGTTLVKGEEFGYFCYGGSDMVMVFEKGKVDFTAQQGVHYHQGEKIAQASAGRA
jgi:phosphatidylserine decarboxylase precursor